MRKRLIEAGVGLLGLVVIALAVASATLWRADDVLVARATATAGLVVTDPGVLELGGDPVTVRAQVPAGARVVLAVGRDTDVTGWVGNDAYQRVSGLSGWRTLRLAAPATAPTASASAAAPASTSTQSAAASEPAGAAGTDPAATPAASSSAAPAAAAVPAADPSGSDMWVARATGTGSAQLVWHAQDGRWSLLVAGIGADGSAVTPTVEMSWPRVVSAPWLVPGLVLGGLLLVAGVGLLGRDWWRARTGHDGWTSVETGSMPEVQPAGPAPALTRRQLRELQSRSGRPPTGAVQAVGSVDSRAAATAAMAPAVPAAAQAPSPQPVTGPGGVPSERRAASLPPVAGRLPGAPGAGAFPAPAVSSMPSPTRQPQVQETAAEAARRAAAVQGFRAGRTPDPLVQPHAGTRTAGPAASPRPEVAGAPDAVAPTTETAPPWAVGGRRARRAASAHPDAAGDPRQTSDGPVFPGTGTTHEGRPAWAARSPALAPEPAPAPGRGAPLAGRPQAAPGAPLGQRSPAQGADQPRPGAWSPDPRSHPGSPERGASQPSTPSPAPGQTVPPRLPPQAPRPGGWVPMPGAGAPSGRPTPAAGPDVPAGSRAPVHPSWLADRPDQPAPGSRPPAVRPPSSPPGASDEVRDVAGDEIEDTPSSRADAWRRAWGLPTEPPADERRGER